ncbi:hypothetical protein Sme01_12810 [Sphaerisporangium melleum]|uniref:Exo-alpha-sialidase n=1 Tax=Sphaerisporangium melleum TaxID=321316 RepID=A0A917VS30_9ACTN|nr:hypothetical protein [Sphaerisporangium melleum]GGL08609.1 hypothetical protein GCM10007964_58620 [Sphaerisporangium melleum]GII68805.1 hypothetical protein Sme01_12810 [Sphaerisporangium melleum]
MERSQVAAPTPGQPADEEVLSVVSGPHDPRSSWRSADDADRGDVSHTNGPRQARTSPRVLHHAPPGPADPRSRDLPLESPWALPPFGAPTPDERPAGEEEDPTAPQPRLPSAGRHPYARPAGSPYGEGAAEPRHSAGRAASEPSQQAGSAWPAAEPREADPAQAEPWESGSRGGGPEEHEIPRTGSAEHGAWGGPGVPGSWGEGPPEAPAPWESGQGEPGGWESGPEEHGAWETGAGVPGSWGGGAVDPGSWESGPGEYGAWETGYDEAGPWEGRPAEAGSWADETPEGEPGRPPRRLVDRPDKLVASGPPRTPPSAPTSPPATGVSAEEPEIRVEPRIQAEPEHMTGDERIGRPPGGRPVRPDILVASGPPRPRGGGRGRHHRDQGAGRPPRQGRRLGSRGSGRGLLTPLFVVVVLLAAAGLGLVIVNWVNSPTSSGLRLAAGDGGSGDQAFAAPPGTSGNGSSQVLNAVTSVGSTVVAVGSDTTSPVPRPLFLVSADGGKNWQLGRVAGAEGYQPAGAAGLVTGGNGRWLAAGTEAPGAAGAAARGMWTSTDGRSWTAVDPSRLAAFWSGDRITDLARTATGFVAVGSTTLQDGGYGPVAWVSPDGTNWSRVDTGEIGSTDKVRAIRAVVAKGNAVVALADPGRGDTTSVILRSPDGGRTWLRTAAALPGVRPEPGALAVAAKGFLLVPTLQKSGSGDVRVYCSELGDEWRQCGMIDGLGREATGVRGLASSSAGVAAVAESGWERYAVFTSTDGKDWTESTDLGQIPGTLRGLAITDGGTLVAAGDQRSGGLDNLPVLMTAGKGKPAAPVPLGQISGLSRSARETTALVAAGESFVAVGGVKGDAGIWTSATGQSWKPVSAPALGGPGRQAFNDVAHGPHGWLAVGSTTADSAFVRPLLASSADARSWRPAPDSPALGASGRYAVVPRVVAAGPKGYVIAGDDSGPDGVVAALWFTPDLKRYSRAAPRSLPAGGADVRIEDVTATSGGYLAVGSSGATGRTSGVVWVSKDGLNWTARKRVIPEGARAASLRRVVVHDQRIIAVGGATGDKGVEQPYAAVSTDDGVSWTYSWLPADAPATVLDLAASEDGLVAVGSYGSPAGEDSAVWTSKDGDDWQRHTLTGDGMTGEGAQWLGAIAVNGDRVVAVGRSTTYTSDHLTLWRTSFSR